MSLHRPNGLTDERRNHRPLEEDQMLSLSGKNVVVIGGSRGVGRQVVEAAVRDGARVLAVARQEAPLQQLARDIPGTKVLSLDASQEGAPAKVFDVLAPDILVVGGGALPPAAPLHEQTWQQFAILGDRRQDRLSFLQGGAVAPAFPAR
jgi:NADP-dependent 3-hydroxy acid dehydrogenase YdfG